MKRFFALLSVILLFAMFTACDGGKPNDDGYEDLADPVEITMWSYPIGGWNSSTSVPQLINEFNEKHPDIKISNRAIEYDADDKTVEDAIKNHATPDIIFEGPERLVANWGARGLMADIGDLWQDTAANDILANIKEACHNGDGVYYEYPLCMTTHCMAINYEMFKEADALKYINEETHTWTTENFFKAVAALKERYPEKDVAAVYCNGFGGDQGTRALINNLYGGTFADLGTEKYTVNSEANIRALTELRNTDGIVFDDTLNGAGEISKFCDKELAMAFCWNVSSEITNVRNNKINSKEVFPMAFPTQSGDPKMQGGIWGFGIFDNGDDERIEAAKTFIRFVTQGMTYESAVIATGFWAVKDLPNIYANDALMTEYGMFQKYLGEYYQIMPNWANARIAWYTMLQKIGNGEDIAAAVSEFSQAVNSEKTSS